MHTDPSLSRFERAADAIIAGNLEALRTLLREYPALIHERSTRAHQSTLLHYVSANGIEDIRQITPPNIVDITRLLIDAGAEIDAHSNAYGGGTTTLGLIATSAHPRLAGVQLALIDLFVARGASIGAIDADGQVAHTCLANGCPEAARHLLLLGAQPHDIYGAAVLGDIEAVQQHFPTASVTHRERALIVAAQCERSSVVAYLLAHGVNVAASDGMTALHWAAANANLPMIRLLVAHNAPLEALNGYGGTVLSSTLWFANHALPADFAARDYPAVLDLLIAAGGRTDFYPHMQRAIDEVHNRARRL